MIGIILWIVAMLLSTLVIPIGIITGIICDLYKHQIGTAISKASVRFRAMAVAVDQYGNIACPELFQFFLTKGKNCYQFGIKGETISYVIGMNKDSNTLTGFGRFICTLLIKFKDPLNKTN